jgi:putative transposase
MYGDSDLFLFNHLNQIELELTLLYNWIMKSYTTYKSNNNVVYSCKYHVVWCPKYRRNVLIDGVDERLKTILLDIATEVGAEIIEMEVMPDHVHLLVEVDPQYGINKLVRHLKGASSRILRSEFPWLKSRIPSLWTNSYFVSTVGATTLDIVKQYIENQKGV